MPLEFRVRAPVFCCDGLQFFRIGCSIRVLVVKLRGTALQQVAKYVNAKFSVFIGGCVRLCMNLNRFIIEYIFFLSFLNAMDLRSI